MRLLLPLMLCGFLSTVQAGEDFDPLLDERAPDAEFPAAVVELAIKSEGDRMPGHIYLADGPGPHPTFLLLHGLPGNEKNLDIAQVLRRDGFNVVFFHYRGAWGAEGNYKMSSLDEDVLAMLDYLRLPANASRLRIDTDNLSLLGHSLGGFTALAAGSQDPAVTCVAAMSPANLGVWKSEIDNPDSPLIKRLSGYADSLFMLRGMNASSMLADLKHTKAAQLDTTLFGPGLRGKSVLMVVGDKDSVTPPETMFSPAVAAYQKESAIDLSHSIISGDHSFSWSRIELTRLILDWAQEKCR
jgi:pimeloyl-ACP methyl ester carboxylesterase